MTTAKPSARSRPLKSLMRGPSQGFKCGREVMRCPECGKTVGKARIRAGMSCPRHPGVEPVKDVCRNDVATSGAVCSIHGANGRQLSSQTVQLVEKRARTMLARLGEPDPIGHPIPELLALAAENKAWLAVLRDAVSDMETLTSTDEFGAEQARATVTLYVKALGSLQKALVDLARLNLEERMIRLEEATVVLVAGVMDKVLAKWLPADQLEAVRAEMSEALIAEAERTQ